MPQDLTHLKTGDKIAIENRLRPIEYSPEVSYLVLDVVRVTETQITATAVGIRRHYQVNREDGSVVGEPYATYAVEATPALLGRHEWQVAELVRWHAARESTADLINKPLHKLKLSTAQLERLAEAWTEIKAMGSATDVQQRNEADAKLMAAAPHLLTALQLAMPVLEALRKQWPRSPHDDSLDVVQVAQAALNKATKP